MLEPIPLDLITKSKYYPTLDDYFAESRLENDAEYYEGDLALPWSFWRDDVDHIHPDVLCEILPRAWEHGDDVRVHIHYEGTDEECYSYMLRSEVTELLYIIFISENMSLHGLDEFTADQEAEKEWSRLAS